MFKKLITLISDLIKIETPVVKSTPVEIKMAPLKYHTQLLCKLHQRYSGATEPVNGCEVCWEIYKKKIKTDTL
jgi:hypothetical protein